MSAEIAAKPLRNAKHEAVLQAYFADPERVGYRCYIGVYPNSGEAAAKTAFSRLLKNADFAARLEFLGAGIARRVEENVGITVERVIGELAKIGFANMGNYFRAGDDGVPRLKLSELSADQMAALQEVTCEEEVGPGDADELPTIVRKTKFKLHPKITALVAIGEHLGAFVKKHADPDGRALGTGAVEAAAKAASELSELELARRIAFALEQGARTLASGQHDAPIAATPAPKRAAKPAKTKKGKC